jgi:hypothetical protein
MNVALRELSMSALPRSNLKMEEFRVPFTSNRRFERTARLFPGAMHTTPDDACQVLDGTA